jgi:hypothetical protein
MSAVSPISKPASRHRNGEAAGDPARFEVLRGV